MTKLGVLILVGDDAEKHFGHLRLRDPGVMRKQTAEAFGRIRAIINAAKGSYLWRRD